MGRAWWSAFLVASLGATGVYFLLPDDGTGMAWLYIGVFAVSLATVVAAVRVNRPEGAVVWRVLAAGQAVIVASGVVRYLYPTLAGVVLPYPSVGDVLYLCAYPVYAVALKLLARRRGMGSRRLELVDAAIIAIATGVLSWVFLIAPNLQNSALPPLARGVSVAYPLMDLLLVAMAARLVVGAAERTPALWLLLGWITCQLLGDTGFALAALHGTFHLNHPLFAGWLGAYGFLGAAALHPSMRTLATVRQGPGLGSRRRSVTLAVAGLIAPGVMVVHDIRSGHIDTVVVALAAAVLVVLILVRLGRVIDVLEDAEEQLTRSEARLTEAQRVARVGSFEVDLVNGRTTGSAEMFRVFGLEPALERSTDALVDLLHPDDRHRVEAVLELLPEDPSPYVVEARVVRPDGQIRTLLGRGEGVRDQSGAVVRAVGTMQDVTDLHRIQEEAARLASIVEFSHDAIIGVTLDGVVVDWNTGAQRLFGYSGSEIIGQDHSRLLPPEIPDEWPRWRRRLADGSAITDHETVRVHCDGHRIPVAMTISPIQDDAGTVTGASVIVRDITERKQLEEELTHQALHDPLTGLANRTLLQDRVSHAVARTARIQHHLTLLFIDLDDFKLINDSLGHDAGDRLLAAVAGRLRGAARASDTIARLGGDEFAILLERAGDRDSTRMAERVLADLEDPIDIDGTTVIVHASIGIAHHGGQEDAGVMLRNADLAMYAAKHSGKRGYRVFEPAMEAAVTERLHLEAALRQAVAAERFELHYQPIVALPTRDVVGFEALLRWTHPERGPLGPDRFIPVLEESGLIVPLGNWIIREACSQAAAWQAHTGRALSISVNVSPRQLEEPGFVEQITSALTAADLPASSLMLEITEGVMLGDTDLTIGRLDAVSALGVRIAVDDFGTGYSSLRYLQTLPVDTVKIDRSFIAQIQDSPEQAALAQAIVKVGHTLHLDVVAEGIESAEQADYLEAIGCQYGQGYHFARPQDAATIEAGLRTEPAGVRRGTTRRP